MKMVAMWYNVIQYSEGITQPDGQHGHPDVSDVFQSVEDTGNRNKPAERLRKCLMV